jgi:hypothetical protein
MLLTRIFGRRREATQPIATRESGVTTPRPAEGSALAQTGTADALARRRKIGVVDTEAGFDPYNSGAFVSKDGAWERVNKR